MKLVLDELIDNELRDYLLTQEGITEVKLDKDGFFTTIDINYTNKTTPYIIMKHIELFQEVQFPILFGFDKGTTNDFNTLKHTIKDMCCEFCYIGLIIDLFKNEKIKSVKSNFDYKKPAFDIEFTIEYDKDYSKDELLHYIFIRSFRKN